MRKDNLSYKYFNVLEYFTVIKSKKKRKYAKCKCNCGKIFNTRADNLNRSKGCPSCGHKFGGNNRVLPNNKAAKFALYMTYLRNAQNRNLSFKLTEKQVEEYSSKNCYYCGTPPQNANYLSKSNKTGNNYYCNGIDRLDNTLGYFKENCVTCCTECNMMKKSLKKEDFLNKIKQIYNFLKLN